jgi:hypothetical protein
MIGEKVLALVRSVNSSFAHIRASFEPYFCVTERKAVGFIMHEVYEIGFFSDFKSF